MCMLKDHNLLGINNGSYSISNFFSISHLSSFIFLINTRNLWLFSKIAICKSGFFFFLLKSERSKNQAAPMVATIIQNNLFIW